MKSTLRFQLISRAMIIVLCVFTAYSVITIYYGIGLFRSELIRDYQNTLDKTAENIAYVQNDIKQFASVILVDSEIAALLRRTRGNDFERILQFYKMQYLLKRYKIQKNYIFNIYIEAADGMVFSGSITEILSGNNLTKTWIERIRARNVPRGFSELHSMHITNMLNNVITFSTPLLNLQGSPQFLGTLYINVNFDVFEQSLRGGDQVFESLVLRTSDGIILYSSFSGEPKNQTRTNPYRIVSSGIPDDWILDAVVPQNAVQKALRSVLRLYLILAAGCILAIILVLVPIISFLTRPLIQVTEATRQLSEGNLDVRINIKAKNELRILADSFNEMIEKLNIYIRRIVEDEKNLQNIKNDFLMAQINPHFIYNTLNSVIYLALEGKNDDVAAITRLMIRILQDNLKFGKQSFASTIAEETASVENYLELQRYRYPGRFSYRIETEDGLANQEVPRLLLQPLVENALFHGLLPDEGVGTIVITVRCSGASIELLVEDNGVGMDEETRRKLLSRKFDQTDHNPRMRPIGIANIMERLKLFYADQYHFSITSSPGRGTVIQIILSKEVSLNESNNPAGAALL